jgi:hypothetical protein
VVMIHARRVVAALAFSAGAYALVLRPRLLRWGASDEEVQQPYRVPSSCRAAGAAPRWP